MLVFAVLLSIAVAQNLNTCPGSISQTGWCDCAPANSGIVLQQFFFTPNPPVPGQNITGSITVKDVYSTAVTGGTVNVMIQYSGIPLVNQATPLCSILSAAHAAVPSIPACPVPPTTLKQLQFNQFIPNSFPAGPYSGMVNATDQTGRVIQCVQFNFNLS